MRKILFFIFSVVFYGSLYAQPFEISFSGSGASTQIDSVKVSNLNLNSTLLLSGNDILVLDQLLGQNSEVMAGHKEIKVFPNPFSQYCFVSFKAASESKTMVEISGTDGKTILKSEYLFASENAQCKIENLPQGLYFLKIITGSNIYTAKMLSIYQGNQQPGINFLSGFDINENHLDNLKQTEKKNVFQNKSGSYHYMTYHPGEILLFIAYSGNFSTVVPLIATQTQVLDFLFVPCADADSNHYPVVHTGGQTWMASNLKTTHYRNGDTIQHVSSAAQWPTMATGAFCNYNNSPDSVQTWGRLYNWYAANDNRKIAPSGWRVPDKSDFSKLANNLGGTLICGGKLKETGDHHWIAPNNGATNESGFTALPTGSRVTSGSFQSCGTFAPFWTNSTDLYQTQFGVYNWLGFTTNEFRQESIYKICGNAVRCLLREIPEISTDSVKNIEPYKADLYGTVYTEGSYPVTEKGFCLSVNMEPTLNNAVVIAGSGTGAYTNTFSGLMSDNKYYFRAYAINAADTAYGNILNFYTYTGQPVFTTLPATNITHNSAVSGGNIDTLGGFISDIHGVCYGLSPQPGIAGSHTVDGAGTGTYASQITGLIPGKKYYIRAYSTNAAGTVYGTDDFFTTLPTLPELSTTAISGYTYPTAVSGGNITYNGGDSIIARGVCWATHHNPTIADVYTIDGTGSGTFSSNISGTSNNAIYYVRAYATNSIGTAYGNEVVLQTFLQIGQPYQGGKIAYIFSPGNPGYVAGETHGLIASVITSIGQAEWGCWSVWVNTSEAMGSGAANTASIIAACPTPGIAARLCDDYSSDGYTDWFLPSKTDLIALFDNRNSIGYTPGFYWSSSQSTNSADSWGYNFYFELLGTAVKSAIGYVRPVRTF